VEKELGINRLKMKQYIDKGLVEPVNPLAKKGRLYILTQNARDNLNLPAFEKSYAVELKTLGWITASPKQRLVVLNATDSEKRTSENIRKRAARFNPCLSRISTKEILKKLVGENLIITEMINRKRYYKISEKGKKIISQMNKLNKQFNNCL
jgi:DNA-binding PadR family transcriptional regulator